MTWTAPHSAQRNRGVINGDIWDMGHTWFGHTGEVQVMGIRRTQSGDLGGQSQEVSSSERVSKER